MNSNQIKEFEIEIKKKLNLDVELLINDSGKFYILYYINDIVKYKINPNNYQCKKYIFQFSIISHPNCGMDIIQNIEFNNYGNSISNIISKGILKDLFKFTIRKIFPKETNKHIFFSFQNPILTKILTEIGWKPVYKYINYNHGTDASRTIWMLDIKNYKGLSIRKIKEDKKSQDKAIIPSKESTKKINKNAIIS